MLNAEERERNEDVGDFDKSQIVMVRKLSASPEQQGLGGVLMVSQRVPTESGPRRKKP